jgi:hypothetical protein
MSQMFLDFNFVEKASTTPCIRIDPSKIIVQQVSTSTIISYQKNMSKAIWRPAPGRKLGFLIWQENYLLGISFLASPVINMGARDERLELPKDPSKKGKELRHYADLSVCVSAQPIGWHWNLGKLIALISTTFGNFWEQQYGDELKGIITTSLWGKSSQYNRIYKFLGYTKGYGHEHISDEKYLQMMKWLTKNNFEIPSSRFGEGSNPRMRRIVAYRKASGDKTINVMHGKKRGIYYHQSVDPNERQAIINNWFERWGLPRYEKTKMMIAPYQTGLEGEKK